MTEILDRIEMNNTELCEYEYAHYTNSYGKEADVPASMVEMPFGHISDIKSITLRGLVTHMTH